MTPVVEMPNEAERTRLRLIEMLTPMLRTLEHGCSDTHCNMVECQGMGTNGGCRCWQGMHQRLFEAALVAEPLAASPIRVDRCCWRKSGGAR